MLFVPVYATFTLLLLLQVFTAMDKMRDSPLVSACIYLVFDKRTLHCLNFRCHAVTAYDKQHGSLLKRAFLLCLV